MSQLPLQVLPTYTTTVKQFVWGVKSIDRSALLIKAMRAFNIFSVVLLSALVLRVILSLFLITGPFMELIMALTTPFVAPFRSFMPEVNGMVQTSAILAYIVYFTLYMLIVETVRSSYNVKDTV